MNEVAEFRYGFRIVGDCGEERRLVDWPAAFAAHADADPKAEPERECYLSAFTFGRDFKDHLNQTRSTKGFSGPCYAPWLWIDIDRAGNLNAAKEDARRIVGLALDCYELEESILTFFSGAKGFHVGLPISIFGAEASKRFNRIARRVAERLAEEAGARIDSVVYDKVRAFRAPNSHHRKTGLHKRAIPARELLRLSTEAILKLAAAPEPFEIPDAPPAHPQASADWREAADALARETLSRAERRAREGARLNRVTREFIGGLFIPQQGERARTLFSAAANLGEFECPDTLALALLEEPGRDVGLMPGEVRRQIETGLAHGRKGGAA